MDIASGAAWGYRAVNDTTREDYSFTQTGVVTAITGGAECKWFSFLPTNEWTTKFFVTPIGSTMNSANLATTFNLWGYSTNGLITREGTAISFLNTMSVTCTGGVNLVDMIDATALSVVQNTGGWAWLCEGGINPIIVYKLEYVVSDPTYGGTNNNGYLLSTGSNAW
jgi:hypothetical protein